MKIINVVREICFTGCLCALHFQTHTRASFVDLKIPTGICTVLSVTTARDMELEEDGVNIHIGAQNIYITSAARCMDILSRFKHNTYV